MNQGWGSGSLEERAVVLEAEEAPMLVLVSKVVGLAVDEDSEKEMPRMQRMGNVRVVSFIFTGLLGVV